MQFCGTFAVWILAESLHLSGVITLVVFAMLAARRAPEMLPARLRVPCWAVWEVAVFVLNVLAFILTGFQLKGILARAGGWIDPYHVLFALVVCLTAILCRLAWAIGYRCCAQGRPASKAQRGRLVEMRSEGEIGDSAFQRMEEELDWIELGWTQLLGTEISTV